MTLYARRGLIQVSHYGYFHSPGHEIVKNHWNVSEISYHAVKKIHGHHEIFQAMKKVTVPVKIFHTMKEGRSV